MNIQERTVGAMKMVIAGSRSIKDYDLVRKAIETIINENDLEISAILSGTAAGVDQLGERWGAENNIEVIRYPAPWKDIKGKPKDEIKSNSYGKYWVKAGRARNQDMAKDADAAIVIHDNTSGSKNMIYEMKEVDRPCYVKTLDELDMEENVCYVF